MREMDRKTNRQGLVFVLALAAGCVDVTINTDSDGSDGPGGSGMVAGSSSSEGPSMDESSEGSTTGSPPPGTSTDGSEDASTDGSEDASTDGGSTDGGSTDGGSTGEPACGVVEIVSGVCTCDGEPVSKSVPGPCGPCAFDVAGQCVCPPGLGPQHWC